MARGRISIPSPAWRTCQYQWRERPSTAIHTRSGKLLVISIIGWTTICGELMVRIRRIPNMQPRVGRRPAHPRATPSGRLHCSGLLRYSNKSARCPPRRQKFCSGTCRQRILRMRIGRRRWKPCCGRRSCITVITLDRLPCCAAVSAHGHRDAGATRGDPARDPR